VTRRELIKSAAAAATVLASAGVVESPPAIAQGYADKMAVKAAADQRAFTSAAQRLADLHAAQTRETVAALKRKYQKPVFGKVHVWELVQKLAFCVDAADIALGCANQLIHTQQVVEGMEQDGVQDPDLYLAAILHDLGKVILLAGEAQENVIGSNMPIGAYEPGVGLEHVVLTWNHDEFMYSRIKDHVPEHVAWLVRYHSIQIAQTTPCMNQKDQTYLSNYLWPFRKYDGYTKSPWHVPPPSVLDKYRDLIEKTFPQPITV